MNANAQYRPQSILMLLQIGVIVGGSLLTRGTLKLLGYPQTNYQEWALPIFVRDWGLVLVLIPVTWSLLATKMEDATEWFSRRLNVISGGILLAFLGILLAQAVYLAANPPRHIVQMRL